MRKELRTKKFFLKYTDCNVPLIQALRRFEKVGSLNLYFIGRKTDPFGKCGLYAYLEYVNRIQLKSNKFNLDSFEGEYYSCNQRDEVINFIVQFDTYITNQGKQNNEVDQQNKGTDKKNKEIDKIDALISRQLDQLIEEDENLKEIVLQYSGSKQKTDSNFKNSSSNNESSEIPQINQSRSNYD